MSAQKELLDALLDEIARKPQALVVFDLDDTLFSTAERHLRIMAEYAAAIESKDAPAAGLLRAITREKLRYFIADTAKDAGLADTLVKDLRDFWFARFFTNPYLLEDGVIAGAPAFAIEVVRRGGKPVYMTGRDESMREGTEASLLRHGFPEPDDGRAQLVLKPRFDAPDFAFKNETLRAFKESGLVVAAFDNEPAHVNLSLEIFPDAAHFLLDTRHSGKPVAPRARVHRIKDFRR